MGILDMLMENYGNYPNKKLFIFQNEGEDASFLTSKTLYEKVKLYGSVLQRKLESQESVLIILPQGLEYICTMFACLYANVIAVPVPVTDFSNETLIREKLSYILKDSGANSIIMHSSFKKYFSSGEITNKSIITLDELEDMNISIKEPRNQKKDDLAILLYTSGSMSNPKGVMISHQNLNYRGIISKNQWGISENSKIVSWLPQYHSFALDFNMFAPFLASATCIIFSPNTFISKPELWFQFIDKYQATHIGAPAFAFDYCYSTINMEYVRGYSLATVQAIISGGEPIRKESYKKFHSKFSELNLEYNTLSPLYGMSEMGTVTTKRPGQPLKFLHLDIQSLERGRAQVTFEEQKSKAIASCGEIGENTEILIVNPETFEVCDPENIGEIWVKSPSVSLGYFNRKTETESTFSGVLRNSTSVFLRTGDLGFIRDNELYIVGREKEVIIINGRNHYPVDIEWTIRKNVNIELPLAVFSQEINGIEKVIVAYEAEYQFTEYEYRKKLEDIIVAVSETHGIKIYDVVVLKKGSIPKSGSGKIQRKLCQYYYINNKFVILYQYRAGTFPNSKLTYRENTKPITNNKSNVYCNQNIQDYIIKYLSKELEIDSNLISLNRSLQYYGENLIFIMKFILDFERDFKMQIYAGDILEHRTIESLSMYLATKTLNHNEE